MKHEIHIIAIEEMVEEIRQTALRYQSEADTVINGDYTDTEKADARAAMRGFTLAYLHLIDVARHVIRNYDEIVRIGKETLPDEDDSAFPGNYL